MRYEVSVNSCRICLRKSHKLFSLHTKYNDVCLLERLKVCTGVQITPDPILPGNICRNCLTNLNNAFNFRNLARKSDQIIQVFVNQKNKDSIIVALNDGKTYKLPKELTLRVLKKTNNTRENPEGRKIGTEHIIDNEEIYENEEYLSDINNDDKIYSENEYYNDNNTLESLSDEKANDDESTNKQINSVNENSAIKLVNLDSLKIDPTKSSSLVAFHRRKFNEYREIIKKLESTQKYDNISLNESKNGTEVPTIRLHVKKDEKKEIHVCEICGNTYYHKYQFTVHMRRHYNEKPFNCEICDKAFLTTQGLKRHMRTHVGLKPFKCQFCHRSFYCRGSRRAHEKVHSGIRPYICQECGKAFAYSFALKKHTLIHQQIKNYKCTLCNKSFRLMHHLKQHEETLVHQEAIKKDESLQMCT